MYILDELSINELKNLYNKIGEILNEREIKAVAEVASVIAVDDIVTIDLYGDPDLIKKVLETSENSLIVNNNGKSTYYYSMVKQIERDNEIVFNINRVR